MSDLISREALEYEIGTSIEPFTLSSIYRAINNAPTVDAEPVRHGHWINERFVSYIGSISVGENGEPIARECIGYHCSLCGRYEHEIQPYCNCGAKMDEKEYEK